MNRNIIETTKRVLGILFLLVCFYAIFPWVVVLIGRINISVLMGQLGWMVIVALLFTEPLNAIWRWLFGAPSMEWSWGFVLMSIFNWGFAFSAIYFVVWPELLQPVAAIPGSWWDYWFGWL